MKGIERLQLMPRRKCSGNWTGPYRYHIGNIGQAGGARVITSDLYQQRLTISKELGLTDAIDASGDSKSGAGARRTGRGADAAILAVGGNGLIRTAMDAVRPGGRVLLFAQTARGEATIDPAAVCVDEKKLLGSYSASVELQDESVRFVMGREMDLERINQPPFPVVAECWKR